MFVTKDGTEFPDHYGPPSPWQMVLAALLMVGVIVVFAVGMVAILRHAAGTPETHAAEAWR